MNAFKNLLDIADKLHGPEGCPWDREQTFQSLTAYVLEEAHEVIEAVDEDDDKKIIEELGDLFYTVVFYAKLAEKQGRFTLSDLIGSVAQKLVRRHPHVFGKLKVENSEEVMYHWERIKKGEEGKEKRTSALDGIPKTLPALFRAQKMLRKMNRLGFTPAADTQQTIHGELLALVMRATQEKIDLEGELRRAMETCEKEFRTWEKQ